MTCTGEGDSMALHQGKHTYADVHGVHACAHGVRVRTHAHVPKTMCCGQCLPACVASAIVATYSRALPREMRPVGAAAWAFTRKCAIHNNHFALLASLDAPTLIHLVALESKMPRASTAFFCPSPTSARSNLHRQH